MTTIFHVKNIRDRRPVSRSYQVIGVPESSTASRVQVSEQVIGVPETLTTYERTRITPGRFLDRRV